MDVTSEQGTSIAWSHDGQRLAASTGLMHLWLVPVGRWKEATWVFLGRRKEEDESCLGRLSWSPDDAHVGFTVARYPSYNRSPIAVDEHVAVLDWRRGTVATLTSEPLLLFDWSVQNRLLGLRWMKKGASASLWVFDVAAGEWTLVQEPPGFEGASWPRWTADEQVIASYAVGDEPDGINQRREVYLLDWRNGSWRSLGIQFVNSSHEGIPAMSPDGRRIAWIENYFRGWESDWRIMLYDIAAGTTTEVASSATNPTFPWYALAWAPDSRRLAFTARPPELDRTWDTIMILTLDQPCPATAAATASPAAP